MNEIIEKDDAVVLVEKPKEEKKEYTIANGTHLQEMFDRYQKKIYLFDESGSMSEGMAPEDERQLYKWTSDVLTSFRNFIESHIAGEIVQQDPSLDPAKALDEAKEVMRNEDLYNDEKLKSYILQNRIHTVAKHIKLEEQSSWTLHTERKIDAVKGAMKKFVEQRFKRFPDAQVAVFGFTTTTEIKCYAGALKEEVLAAIDRLTSSGGTQIFQAVERAVQECKRRPSKVGAHHIVLVTDAQDYSAERVQELRDKMKEMNIVFDFIFVKGMHGESAPANVVKILQGVCSQTGGEYNEVSKSSDFTEKFLEVSSRRALPPARY